MFACMFCVCEVAHLEPSMQVYCHTITPTAGGVAGLRRAARPWASSFRVVYCRPTVLASQCSCLQAGLQACYVQRDPGEPYPAFLSKQPQLVVRSFEEMATQLAGG